MALHGILHGEAERRESASRAAASNSAGREAKGKVTGWVDEMLTAQKKLFLIRLTVENSKKKGCTVGMRPRNNLLLYVLQIPALCTGLWWLERNFSSHHSHHISSHHNGPVNGRIVIGKPAARDIANRNQ
ncbi:hypothetical protein MTO96_028663 [Rhipicephalus appendiculatus]